MEALGTALELVDLTVCHPLPLGTVEDGDVAETGNASRGADAGRGAGRGAGRKGAGAGAGGAVRRRARASTSGLEARRREPGRGGAGRWRGARTRLSSR